MFQFYKNWLEFFFLLIMAVGLILALFTPSAAVNYMLIFVSGIFAGRLVYERRKKVMLPFLIIIAGFILGYLIGMRYGNRIVVIIIFLIGAVLSYQLFNKRILKDSRF